MTERDLVERLRNPMWEHSSAPNAFLSPQLCIEDTKSDLTEAADEIERLRNQLVKATSRSDRLRLELEKIGWMDEFLDAAGARAMMNIAREAVNQDEDLTDD